MKFYVYLLACILISCSSNSSSSSGGGSEIIVQVIDTKLNGEITNLQDAYEVSLYSSMYLSD